MLVSKEFSRTSISGLDLVQDKKAAVFVAKQAQPVNEFHSRLIYAGHSLDSLNDDCCKPSSGELIINSFKIIQRSKDNIVRSIERSLYLGIVSRSHSSRCPSVECLAECQYLRLSGMERRYFQGILVCLSPTVTKEKRIIVIPTYSAQSLSQIPLQRILYGI